MIIVGKTSDPDHPHFAFDVSREWAEAILAKREYVLALARAERHFRYVAIADTEGAWGTVDRATALLRRRWWCVWRGDLPMDESACDSEMRLDVVGVSWCCPATGATTLAIRWLQLEGLAEGQDPADLLEV
jgi:hypothetical protein